MRHWWKRLVWRCFWRVWRPSARRPVVRALWVTEVAKTDMAGMEGDKRFWREREIAAREEALWAAERGDAGEFVQAAERARLSKLRGEEK